MKKYYLVPAFLIIFGSLAAQKISLNTNGYNLNFEKVDSLFYAEYSTSSMAKINSKINDENIVNLKYAIGKISKTREELLKDSPIFTTNYYAYQDGTLQAPTTQLFFKPINILNLAYGRCPTDHRL